jgi:glutathione peroxidase
MNIFRSLFTAAFAATIVAGCANAEEMPAENAPVQEAPKKEESTVLQFKMQSLDGKEVDLSQYKGKVTMLVNTASKCGNTPQYAGLQKLHDKYAEQGLAILGFPANNFGKQEPGNNEEIGEFCRKNYGVKFDMFSKISVKGEDKAPLYQYLTSAETNPQFPGEISWNFEKFLIGRDGKIAARFAPKVKPESPEVVAAIEAELAK